MQTTHSTPTSHTQELSSRQSARALAEQAFSRAARLILFAGILLLGMTAFLFCFPRVAGYGLAAIVGWIGIALVHRGWKVHRKRNRDMNSR